VNLNIDVCHAISPRSGHDVKLHRLNIVIDDVARGVQSAGEFFSLVEML